MAEIDLILGSASALYGFTVAYYVFARGLQDQERARLWQDHREWQKPPTEDEVKRAVRKVELRRAALNVFLIISTGWFTVWLTGELAYTVSPQAVFIQSWISRVLRT